MVTDDPIRIQILAAKEDAGTAGHAVTVAREHMHELAGIGRGLDAEALLVCPAPDEFVSDGFPLVILARFPEALDEDTMFWRQRQLGQEIYDALRIDAVVLDLDAPQGRFLKYIEPLLVSPYRDEIGRREGGTLPRA